MRRAADGVYDAGSTAAGRRPGTGERGLALAPRRPSLVTTARVQGGVVPHVRARDERCFFAWERRGLQAKRNTRPRLIRLAG